MTRFRVSLRTIILLQLVFGVFFTSSASSATSDTPTIAVAANFARPMRVLLERFRGETGDELRMVVGSSGKLYAQIRNGAPFHAFFSADQEKPLALEQEGLALSGSRFTYAVGELVLWSPGQVGTVDGEALLRAGDYRRLALANPRLAPYGRAALEVLQALGQANHRERWVMGENVSQALQFVVSGNADVGLIARSLISPAGRWPAAFSWTIPGHLHAPILQDALVLAHAQGDARMLALVTFLRTPVATQIMRDFGYAVPVPRR